MADRRPSLQVTSLSTVCEASKAHQEGVTATILTLKIAQFLRRRHNTIVPIYGAIRHPLLLVDTDEVSVCFVHGRLLHQQLLQTCECATTPLTIAAVEIVASSSMTWTSYYLKVIGLGIPKSKSNPAVPSVAPTSNASSILSRNRARATRLRNGE